MKKRAQNYNEGERKLKIILGILIIVIFVLVAMVFKLSPKSTSIIERFTLELGGFEKVSVAVEPPNTILLTAACQQIEATTTLEQADSISQSLEGRTGERPNAHELASTIFSEYGIEVIAVKIDDFKDGAYHSTLVVQQSKKVLRLDARPSDAIAIALRMGKPVYIKKEFFEILGKRVC